eukprot:CAMPEP_0173442782 /NCGR_PEP_ID=MMETSP1357-20121228/28184_1 /TAXON_ID=77926 /ORGANISM="Hemiselmis rufescens, Strain PCC563" /LENGTH=31 /DNA_ID= /DNA_START= /DNA_END= /DNA_ORIENTATION=
MALAAHREMQRMAHPSRNPKANKTAATAETT